MDANTSTVFVALLVSVIAPTIQGALANLFAANRKREDWKRQDEVAARLVKNDASKFEKLNKLQATADGTKTIVNNQRTALLLLNAELRERIAREHPEDIEAQQAAKAARLEANRAEAVNASPH